MHESEVTQFVCTPANKVLISEVYRNHPVCPYFL